MRNHITHPTQAPKKIQQQRSPTSCSNQNKHYSWLLKTALRGFLCEKKEKQKAAVPPTPLLLPDKKQNTTLLTFARSKPVKICHSTLQKWKTLKATCN